MWCPEGCSSWNTILSNLRETTEQVLKLVALAQMPPETDARRERHWHATICLTKGGFADDDKEGELIIAITTLYLMVNLLEHYPPIVSNVSGNRLELDGVFFSHRDQFECCTFGWPLKSDPQFRAFFEYAKNGGFDGGELFQRFCFFNPDTGKLADKNGSGCYLINGLGFSEFSASEHCRFIRGLEKYYVFWSELPDEQEYRDLFGCIEVNGEFTLAINTVFGEGAANSDAQLNVAKIGRPKLRDEVARAYSEMFPTGHVSQGVTWKGVAQKLSQALGRTVTVATIRRGLRERNDQK